MRHNVSAYHASYDPISGFFEIYETVDTHVGLAPMSMHLDLLDLADDLPRCFVVLGVVLMLLFRVYRTLVPSSDP